MTVDDAELLAAYDPRSYPPVAVTADVAVLTIRDGELCVLLVERAAAPFAGRWALPGGFVDEDEDLDTAAARTLARETGLTSPVGHLEQLRTYGDPGRDPRLRVIAVAYVALLPVSETPVAGRDATRARFWPVADLADVELAFDHAAMVDDAVERTRSKLEYSTLATSFVGAPFTIADLRRVYEHVWGTTINQNNFRRKVLSVPGFVEPTGDAVAGRGKPAPLYRPGPATLLQPAMLRPDLADAYRNAAPRTDRP